MQMRFVYIFKSIFSFNASSDIVTTERNTPQRYVHGIENFQSIRFKNEFSYLKLGQEELSFILHHIHTEINRML